MILSTEQASNTISVADAAGIHEADLYLGNSSELHPFLPSTKPILSGVVIVFLVLVSFCMVGATADSLVLPLPAKHISAFSVQALDLT